MNITIFAEGTLILASYENVHTQEKRFTEAIKTENGFQCTVSYYTTVTPQSYHCPTTAISVEMIYIHDAQPLANVGIAEKHGDDFGEEESYEHFSKNKPCFPSTYGSCQNTGRKDTCCLFNYGLAV